MTEKRITQRPVRVPPSREDDLYRATRDQAERERGTTEGDRR